MSTRDYKITCLGDSPTQRILTGTPPRAAEFFTGGDSALSCYFTASTGGPLPMEGLAQVTLHLKAMRRSGMALFPPAQDAPALIERTAAATPCTAEEWAAGTGAHATFHLAGAEMSLVPEGTYWMAFEALATDGHRYPLNAGRVSFLQSGIATPGDPHWTRPVDRPAEPSREDLLATRPEGGGDALWLLLGLTPRHRSISFTVQVSTFPPAALTAQCAVDFGDGQAAGLGTLPASQYATLVEHAYDYEALAAPVSNEGVKWVWLKLHGPPGAFQDIAMRSEDTYYNFPDATTFGITPLRELHVQAPMLNYLYVGTSSYYETQWKHIDLDSIRIWDNALSDGYGLSYLPRLRRLTMDAHRLGENGYGSILSGLDSYTGPGDLTLASPSVTNIDILGNCPRYSGPVRAAFPATTSPLSASVCNGNVDFDDTITIDAPSAPSVTLFLYDMPRFNSAVTINTPGTKRGQINNCHSFNQPLWFSLAPGTHSQIHGSRVFNHAQDYVIGFLSDSMSAASLSSLRAYTHPVTLSLAGITSTSLYNPIGTCPRVPSLRFQNMPELAWTGSLYLAELKSLTHDSIVGLLGDLSSLVGKTARAIVFSNQSGATALTPEEIAIATAKNWTVSVSST